MGAQRGGWHRGDIPAVSPHQDLLKHTPEDHPDHPFLIDAQRNIKQVAERINKGMKSAEEVERNARIVQEIESHIEGMEDVRTGGLGVGSWVAMGKGDRGASCRGVGTPSLAEPFCSPDAPKGAAPTPELRPAPNANGVGLSFCPKLSHFCCFWVELGWATCFLVQVLLSSSSLAGRFGKGTG